MPFIVDERFVYLPCLIVDVNNFAYNRNELKQLHAHCIPTIQYHEELNSGRNIKYKIYILHYNYDIPCKTLVYLYIFARFQN